MKTLTLGRQIVTLSFVGSSILFYPLISQAKIIDSEKNSDRKNTIVTVSQAHANNSQNAFSIKSFNNWIDLTNPEVSPFIFYILTGMGITFIAIGLIWLEKQLNKVFVNLHTAKISLKSSNDKTIHCEQCSQAMEQVTTIKLNPQQKIAQKLGGVSYKGYKCPTCSHQARSYLTVAYVVDSFRYQSCLYCKEWTVIRAKEILEDPTYNSEGKLLIKDQCHCCNYHKESIIEIPRLTRSSNSSFCYAGDSSNGGSSGGGSSGGGSSGGDFGGGSSGGDGAGGSF